MSDDLKRYFGALSREVPSTITEDGGYFTFSAQSLPTLPPQLTTDRLYISKGVHEHTYPDDTTFREDVVYFYAEKETYRQLALLILAVVFHPKPVQVMVRLEHPASEVTTLIVSYHPYSSEPPEEQWSGYWTRPYVFRYEPGEVLNHPFHDCSIAPTDLPCFYLTYDSKRKYGDLEETWRRRDVLKGFGTDQGCVRLAELLLNLSRPENALLECQLEGEAGWRSTGPRSVAARFVLPGSFAWDPAQWSPLDTESAHPLPSA